MNKTLIYIAQLTHEHNGIMQNLHFPLASGLISEFLKKNIENLSIEIYKQPNELNNRLIEKLPDIIMFSNYLWNTNLNLEFIKAVKKKNKNILTIMGGPNISNDKKKRIEFVKNNPYLDFYVINEGERVGYNIVKNFIKKGDIDTTKRLNLESTISVINNEVFYVESNRRSRLTSEEYENIPSPYLSGSFNKFFKDSFVPMIETNRGCPFSCSFCQQGGSHSSKIVNFSNERVSKEISYIAKKIKNDNIQSYVLEIADSNFGMYKGDEKTSTIIRHTQDTFNYPIHIHASTGKNKINLILKNLSTLKNGSTFLSLSMQSTNPETLKAVRRENIDINNYKTIYEYQNKNNLRSVSEIMLGLPNESLQTHIEMLYNLIDLGIEEFSLIQTIVLDGTELETDEYANKYGIKYMYRPIQEAFGEYDIFDEKIKICETERVIIQTNTMSHEDYYKARKIHFIITLLHNTDMIKPVYKLLEKFNIKPSDLIKKLFSLKHKGFESIINDFLKDTKFELFKTADKIIYNNNVEKYTYNKIFKHLGISFFVKKPIVLDALKSAMTELIHEENSKVINEIIKIIDHSMISLSDKSTKVEIKIEEQALKDIYGECVLLSLSEKQIKLLNLFKKRYPKFDDMVNNIVCHIRPSNLCLNIIKTNKCYEIL